MRKLSKKQTKSQLKPWITKGIKKSITHRNHHYNLFIKAKNKTLKDTYHNQYKSYRNQIGNLLV